MRRCTTLALILSLSACERANQATQPSTPSPAPVEAVEAAPAKPAPVEPAPPEPTANTEDAKPAPTAKPKPKPAVGTRTQPAPLLQEGGKKPAPVPCRARVCPEWDTPNTTPKIIAPNAHLTPELDVGRPSLGVSRASTKWDREQMKIRIRKVEEAHAPLAADEEEVWIDVAPERQSRAYSPWKGEKRKIRIVRKKATQPVITTDVEVKP